MKSTPEQLDNQEGDNGFTGPAAHELETIVLDGQSAPALRERGITVVGPIGRDNTLRLSKGASLGSLTLRLSGHADCHFVLGNVPNLRGWLNIEGPKHRVVFSGTRGAFNLEVTMRGQGGALLVGRDATANQLRSLIDGQVSVRIGDDAMIAVGVSLRTSDSHSIFSLDDPTCTINPPGDIIIGRHVWLGERCTIMPGCSVGAGSIVGLRSVVTKDVPPTSLVAGVPARIIRERVTWTRSMRPTSIEMADAAARCSGTISVITTSL